MDTPLPRICIIYDTNWLMDGNKSLILDENAPAWKTLVDNITLTDILNFIVIEEVIPTEVVKEIAAMIGHSEKGKAASLGRTTINWFKEHDQLLQEVELATIVEPATALSPIGADSLTDRLIVAYAQRLIEAGYHSVYVVTKDGGIISDLIDLRKAARCPIYSVAQGATPFIESVRQLCTPRFQLSEEEGAGKVDNCDIRSGDNCDTRSIAILVGGYCLTLIVAFTVGFPLAVAVICVMFIAVVASVITFRS